MHHPDLVSSIAQTTAFLQDTVNNLGDLSLSHDDEFMEINISFSSLPGAPVTCYTNEPLNATAHQQLALQAFIQNTQTACENPDFPWRRVMQAFHDGDVLSNAAEQTCNFVLVSNAARDTGMCFSVKNPNIISFKSERSLSEASYFHSHHTSHLFMRDALLLTTCTPQDTTHVFFFTHSKPVVIHVRASDTAHALALLFSILPSCLQQKQYLTLSNREPIDPFFEQAMALLDDAQRPFLI